MVSLLILGIAVGWIALWFYVFKYAPNRGVRVGAVLVALLIPFWDLPIGYFQFQRLCQTEGGVHIYERITPQEKVYFDSVPSDEPEKLLRQGFKVIELRRADGKGVLRQQLHEGKIVSSTVSSPESLVAVSIIPNEKLAWNIYRYEHVARSISSNKILVRHTGFTWRGGWLEDSFAPFLVGRLSCSSPLSDLLTPILQQGA